MRHSHDLDRVAVGVFALEKLAPAPGRRLLATTIREAYEQWAADNGAPQIGRNLLSRFLDEEAGLIRISSAASVTYGNVRLVDELEGPAPTRPQAVTTELVAPPVLPSEDAPIEEETPIEEPAEPEPEPEPEVDPEPEVGPEPEPEPLEARPLTTAALNALPARSLVRDVLGRVWLRVDDTWAGNRHTVRACLLLAPGRPLVLLPDELTDLTPVTLLWEPDGMPDDVEDFLADPRRLTWDPGNHAATAAIYAAFTRWGEDVGAEPMPQPDLTRCLTALGLERRQDRRGGSVLNNVTIPD